MEVEADFSEQDGGLTRSVEFPSFREAIEFVNHVADLAEEEQHHPDILVRYKTVTITWTTHSAGGVTNRDRTLAARTNALLTPTDP